MGGARSSRARPGTGFENSFTALQAFYPELTSPGVGFYSHCVHLFEASELTMMAARLANSGGRGQKKFSVCGSTRSIALSSKIYACILCHSHLDGYQVV